MPRSPERRRARRRLGLTLVELLVALAVALLVVAAAVAITFANRRIYDLDRARTTLNQNLRTGLSILGDDVQVAGERLGDTTAAFLPPVEVVGGDELILRRNLVSAVLPFCEKDLRAGSNEDSITVSLDPNDNLVKNQGHTECVLADANGDGTPDPLEAWSAFRIEHGGVVDAFIITPSTGESEFFGYDAEPPASNAQIHRVSGTWAHDYDIANQPQLYVLEQRRFRRNGAYLEMVVNGDAAAPQRLIPDVTDFQVRALLRDGSVRTDFPQPGDRFADLQAIEVTLTGSTARGRQSTTRELSAQFFPRNVLSQ